MPGVKIVSASSLDELEDELNGVLCELNSENVVDIKLVNDTSYSDETMYVAMIILRV